MSKLVSLLLPVLVLASCQSMDKDLNASADGERYYEVVKVVDGDTLDLEEIGRIRLIGVDTPESVHPRKPVEHFSKEASQFLSRLVLHEEVRVEYDQQKTDKYKRTLAYLYLRDGTFVNAEIIKQGYGHAYTRFPFKYLDEFRTYEKEAREEHRGLWDK